MNGLKVQDFYGRQVIDSRDVAEPLEDRLALLDKCIESAMDIGKTDVVMAIGVIESAFSLVDTPWLETCVMQTFLNFFTQCQPSEKDVYAWFRKNYKMALGDEFDIVRLHNDPKHIPDFWVCSGSLCFPVECKLHDFDEKALNQLKRYMNFYNCSRGVAVAQRCTCKLPESIIFISFRLSEIINTSSEEAKQV